jgi:class 3 adenylate cyclase/predicted ATPase
MTIGGDRGERRQLTVLFCDIVDSTGLSERCDPEELRDVLLEFQSICTRSVENAGGKVVNYIGDGIRAEFGYPMTSENEAESAIRASLALLYHIELLSARSADILGETIRVRIGVHTGLAVIGQAAPGHVHRSTEITGDTPNIAARLQEIAEPGTIAISSETQRLLLGKFRFRSLGLRSLKGLSRQIHVFEVMEELIEDNILVHPHRGSLAPLVDRTNELRQLLQSWETVKGGQGQVVAITGEAGMGKSRLALELVEQLALPHRSIFALTASAYHQNVPLYPLIRELQRKVEIRRYDAPDINAARLNTYLTQTLPEDHERHWLVGQLLNLPTPCPAGADRFDVQEVRRMTRDLLVRLLTSHAQGTAGVVVVEDLRWADPSTSEIVELVAKTIGRSATLMLITSRTDTIRGVNRVVISRHIPLARLEDADCLDLAMAVVKGRPLSAQLVQRIVKRSDGVPLFVEELAAAAVETGEVDTTFGFRRAFPAGSVPSALYDPLMLRLDRLGDAKSVAQVASVIGRSFSHQLIAAIEPITGSTVETALAQLIESGLIRPEGDERGKSYSFKHALVRDVAYYSLLNRQRRVLHARVADKIEAEFPEMAEAEPDYVAQHLSEAGQHARAARMWLKAASRSAQRSANLEAVAQLHTALVEVQKVPVGRMRDDLELDVRIGLIGPTIATQGFASREAAEMSRCAIDLCRTFGDDQRIFPALYSQWSYNRVTGNISEAYRLAKDFLARSQRMGTSANQIVAHRLLGTSLLLVGETEPASEHLQTAIALLDRAEERTTAFVYGTDAEIMSLSHLCIACWTLGRTTLALTHAKNVIALAQRLRHAHSLGYALAHVCVLHTLERDVPAVQALASQMLAAAIEREFPFFATVSRVVLAWCEMQSSSIADGIETLTTQREILETEQFVFWQPTYLCWLAEAYGRLQKFTEAKRALEQARQTINRGGESWYEAECWRIEGVLALLEPPGQAERADQHLWRALALARQRQQRGFALRAAVCLADHLVHLGQLDRARDEISTAMEPFLNEPETGDRAAAKVLLSSLGNKHN